MITGAANAGAGQDPSADEATAVLVSNKGWRVERPLQGSVRRSPHHASIQLMMSQQISRTPERHHPRSEPVLMEWSAPLPTSPAIGEDGGANQRARAD